MSFLPAGYDQKSIEKEFNNYVDLHMDLTLDITDETIQRHQLAPAFRRGRINLKNYSKMFNIHSRSILQTKNKFFR
jgi:hypothetical protein